MNVYAQEIDRSIALPRCIHYNNQYDNKNFTLPKVDFHSLVNRNQGN